MTCCQTTDKSDHAPCSEDEWVWVLLMLCLGIAHKPTHKSITYLTEIT